MTATLDPLLTRVRPCASFVIVALPVCIVASIRSKILPPARIVKLFVNIEPKISSEIDSVRVVLRDGFAFDWR